MEPGNFSFAQSTSTMEQKKIFFQISQSEKTCVHTALIEFYLFHILKT